MSRAVPIMRPEPGPAAGSLDEVGMIIGNAEVVNGRVASVTHPGQQRSPAGPGRGLLTSPGLLPIELLR